MLVVFRICNIDQEWSCDSHCGVGGHSVESPSRTCTSTRILLVSKRCSLIDQSPSPTLESRGCWSSAQLENREDKTSCSSRVRNFQRVLQAYGAWRLPSHRFSFSNLDQGCPFRRGTQSKQKLQCKLNDARVRRGGRNHAERRIQIHWTIWARREIKAAIGVGELWGIREIEEFRASRRLRPRSQEISLDGHVQVMLAGSRAQCQHRYCRSPFLQARSVRRFGRYRNAFGRDSR